MQELLFEAHFNFQWINVGVIHSLSEELRVLPGNAPFPSTKHSCQGHILSPFKVIQGFHFISSYNDNALFW